MTKGWGWGLGAAAAAVMLVLIWWLIGQGADRAVPETAASETAAPAAAPAVVAEPAPAPEPVPEAAPEPAPPAPPRFDVVRVDGGGLATIAGQAPAGADVSLRLDEVEVGRATADASGQFAALLTLLPSDQPRLLGLVARLPDSTEIAGVETVAIAPFAAPVVAEAEPAPEPETAPQAVPALLLSEDGVKVLSEPAPLPGAPVQVDSISYGAAGEVVLAGRATPGAALRFYLDDAAVAEDKADDKGDWQATLAEVAPGLHSLRADEVDAAGKVISRYETPFQREVPVVVAAPAAPEPAPAEPAPEPAPAPITVTVQPGLTLWAIARDNFGEGTMYVQVFEANRDKIKDPDLIYPGQVFTVPKP